MAQVPDGQNQYMDVSDLSEMDLVSENRQDNYEGQTSQVQNKILQDIQKINEQYKIIMSIQKQDEKILTGP